MLVRMSNEERELKEHYNHIVDELLTLKCPRHDCRQAFTGFSGCLAMICSRCNATICANCLKDCGDDRSSAHAHVIEVHRYVLRHVPRHQSLRLLVGGDCGKVAHLPWFSIAFFSVCWLLF